MNHSDIRDREPSQVTSDANLDADRRAAILTGLVQELRP